MILNDNKTIREYTEFRGYYPEQMQKMHELKKKPMTLSEIFEVMSEVICFDAGVKKHWTMGGFTGGNGIIQHPDNIRIKFVNPSQLLSKIDFSTIQLTEDGRAISLTEEDYANINGKEFSRKEMRRFNIPLTYKEAIRHPLLKEVFPERESFHSCLDYLYKKYKCDLGLAMGFYINRCNEKTPELKPLCISNILDGFMVYASLDITKRNDRLVCFDRALNKSEIIEENSFNGDIIDSKLQKKR